MKDFEHQDCGTCVSRSKSIFCELEELALTLVSERKIINTYKKGQLLYHQGNPPYGLYCIKKGKVKVSICGSDGKEYIARLATDGDILGHKNLITNESNSTTATVMEDTMICFLDKKFILAAIQQFPTLALNLIARLGREMGASEIKSVSLVQKSVRSRLAELLLMFKKSFGTTEQDRTRLEIKITREEMASMVGTVTETLIRYISEFKIEGIIEQEGKTIFIKNDQKLIELADLQD